MGETASSAVTANVACPFCGILCDDLVVENTGGGLKVRANGCPKASAGFERQVAGARPQIEGRDVDLTEAVAAAARLIRQARLPLYGGLGTDVQGMRAVMALADNSGGVVDHALSEGQYRNFRVLQSSGWFMSTLTETRNRADLIVILGSDVHTLHPRFFERVVCPAETMFDDPPVKRTIVFVGQGLDRSGATGPRIGDVIEISCPNDQVGSVVAALKAEMKGTQLPGAGVPGVSGTQIKDLAARLGKAAYSVFVWAPPSLSFPHADLTVGLVSELVKEINVKTRSACLSLGGNEGAVSAGAVCGWQSGYPLRVSFASGKPDYDPLSYEIARMLAAGEGDLLTWIASFTPDLGPPETTLPTIVLATPGLKTRGTPAVYIPVGTPGADHAGLIVRCDNVVSLPLKDLKRSTLPSVADVLTAIRTAL